MAEMEFAILDNGLRVEEGRVKYQWFMLAEPSGRSFFRAVALRELTYLPIETRDDPDMLGKQWAALRGLYNASADFLYTAFGIFQPYRLGVVQCYGAAAEAASVEAAAREALHRLAAVEATLANYPQSRTAYPDLARLELLTDRLRRLPRLLAILGHPDPRLAKRGLGRDGAIGQADDELLSQQGENLLRGLARLSEDFVFLVTAAHVDRPALTSALVRMAQIAGQVASRQRGSIGAGFSIAVPLAAALSNAYAQNLGHSQSASHSQADTVSEGWSQSESQSWGHSVGQSQSHGTSHTESTAVTDTVGSSHGVSASTGWGHTDSVANTASGAHTDSVSHTDSARIPIASATPTPARTPRAPATLTLARTPRASHRRRPVAGCELGHLGRRQQRLVGQRRSHRLGGPGALNGRGGHGERRFGHRAHRQQRRRQLAESGCSDATNQSNTASQSQSNTVGASVSAGVPGVVSGSASASHGWTDGEAESLGTSHARILVDGDLPEHRRCRQRVALQRAGAQRQFVRHRQHGHGRLGQRRRKRRDQSQREPGRVERHHDLRIAGHS